MAGQWFQSTVRHDHEIAVERAEGVFAGRGRKVGGLDQSPGLLFNGP